MAWQIGYGNGCRHLPLLCSPQKQVETKKKRRRRRLGSRSCFCDRIFSGCLWQGMFGAFAEMTACGYASRMDGCSCGRPPQEHVCAPFWHVHYAPLNLSCVHVRHCTQQLKWLWLMTGGWRVWRRWFKQKKEINNPDRINVLINNSACSSKRWAKCFCLPQKIVAVAALHPGGAATDLFCHYCERSALQNFRRWDIDHLSFQFRSLS